MDSESDRHNSTPHPIRGNASELLNPELAADGASFCMESGMDGWHPAYYPCKPHVYLPANLFTRFPSLWRDPDLLSVLILALHQYTLVPVTVPVKTGRAVVDVPLRPGQCVFGKRAWATTLHKNASNVLRKISRLGTMGITDLKLYRKVSVLTIHNDWLPEYVTEQNEPLTEPQSDRNRTAIGPQSDLLKRSKEVKEVKDKTLGAKRSRASTPDPRSTHPAILAIRETTLRYPPKDIWDAIIERLGEQPDKSAIKRAWTEWRMANASPLNYGWLDKITGNGHGGREMTSNTYGPRKLLNG